MGRHFGRSLYAIRSFSQTYIVYLNCIYAERDTVWLKLRTVKERERDFRRKGETASGVAAGMRLGSAINEGAGDCIRKLRRTCMYYIAHEDAIRSPLPWLIVIIRGRSTVYLHLYVIYIYIFTHAHVSRMPYIYVYISPILPTAVYYILCGTRFNTFTVEADRCKNRPIFNAVPVGFIHTDYTAERLNLINGGFDLRCGTRVLPD